MGFIQFQIKKIILVEGLDFAYRTDLEEWQHLQLILDSGSKGSNLK
jgi:hypothetical protein